MLVVVETRTFRNLVVKIVGYIDSLHEHQNVHSTERETMDHSPRKGGCSCTPEISDDL